jgi:hypothetical protein
MKEITKYQSENGEVFDTADQALREDSICELEGYLEKNGCYRVNQNAREIAEFMVDNFEFKIKVKS